MVTVIIPSYNYAHFLPDAIESALAQTDTGNPLEVLVIDDGSKDDTAAVAARYGDRIRYHFQANAGLSAARNTGMRIALHDLVVFLDADDLLPAGTVAAFLAARAAQVEPPVVMAGRDQAIALDKQLLAPPHSVTGQVTPVSARSLVLRNRFPTTVLADRRVLLGLGGFDTTLRASEDRDMWIRTAASHSVAMLDQVVLLRRLHGSSMSRQALQQTTAMEQVLAKAFANPALRLTGQDRRLARAVCLYQSALMYAEAGDHKTAVLQFLRSFKVCPLASLAEGGISWSSRIRGLLGNLRKIVR